MSHTLAYGQYEPRPASCGSSSGQFERPATRHGGHHRLVDAGGTQRRTSIARAACGRTSASHAVRHVVQKQVDAVRKRHRACKTSAAVVAVGASCATAVAVGRTRPERVRPARGRGDNELTVGGSRNDCLSSTLRVHPAMANASGMRESRAAKFVRVLHFVVTCPPVPFTLNVVAQGTRG